MGSTVSVESSGSLRAMGVESVSVESSGGVSVSAVGALTGVSGGSSSYVSGGSVSVSGAEGLSGVFGEGAELTASAVRVSSSSVLDASTAGLCVCAWFGGRGCVERWERGASVS